MQLHIHFLVCIWFALILLAQSKLITHHSKHSKNGKSSSTKAPNFIILFADDMGYGDLSFNGHPTIHTPNIDALAHSGMIFTQWYSGFHICGPSRAALLTGRLPVRSGMAGGWKGGNLGPESKGGLPYNETTFAEILKYNKGYATKMIGKWHMGQQTKYLPYFHGFDNWYGIPYSVDMGQTPWDPNAESGIKNPGAILPLFFNTTIIEQPANLATLSENYLKEAINFIGNATDNNESWVLYCAFSHVHVPDFTNEKHCNTSMRGRFGDAISELDWLIGELYNYINDDDNNIDENNIVTFFTSDNGPWLIKNRAGGSAGLFRDGKFTTWEGGIRMPAFIHWPNHILSGSRTMQVACTIDIFATMISLANATDSIPNDLIIDGKDLTNVLLNNGTSPHECIYIYGGTPGADCGNSSDPMNDCPGLWAIRCGSYKAHWVTRTTNTTSTPVKQNPPLLYNIDWDPSEKHPIYPNNIIYNSTIEYLTSMRDAFEATVPNGIPNQVLLGSDSQYLVCCNQATNCSCTPDNWKQFTCNPVCYAEDDCN